MTFADYVNLYMSYSELMQKGILDAKLNSAPVPQTPPAVPQLSTPIVPNPPAVQTPEPQEQPTPEVKGNEDIMAALTAMQTQLTQMATPAPGMGQIPEKTLDDVIGKYFK